MKLTLALSLLAFAAQKVAAQYFIDYYFATANACNGAHQGCDNIASGTCCALNNVKSFFPNARTGSYGPAGFTVWTDTDQSGSTCGNCAVTSGFGCWQNESPFETAFIVGLPVFCANGQLRRSVDMSDSANVTAVAGAPDAEAAPKCTSTVLPNRLSINGRDYAITDENRKEIEADFLNQDNLRFDFAEKWKSAYKGPTAEMHRAGMTPQRKPERGSK
ncbi:hypothetical protein B0T14DRAFT_604083 [Immersiella caudata]|uniref:Uncharacterized protein n=1 Tax=Immersiella caudata TaxID=314043 RepID=A0AA39WSE5_9PEZI|nr:hypothetical protein B0T14DRAFT_604083 [Immersiella caudata]